MEKWECLACGYMYTPDTGDPENGVSPGTPFEDLPADWICPVCGAGKEMFERMGDDEDDEDDEEDEEDDD